MLSIFALPPILKNEGILYNCNALTSPNLCIWHHQRHRTNLSSKFLFYIQNYYHYFISTNLQIFIKYISKQHLNIYISLKYCTLNFELLTVYRDEKVFLKEKDSKKLNKEFFWRTIITLQNNFMYMYFNFKKK